MRQLAHEWQAAVNRDYNHPCIVAWVPLNESWGVPDIPNDPRQTDWLLALYHLTKALDPTRLVISNDGWEHARSDLLTIHDYTAEESVLRGRYSTIEQALLWTPGNHALLAPGVAYNGEPVLVTEFGGIAYRVSDQQGWGYSSAEDDETFVSGLRAVFAPMHESPLVQGFCYTQLTDVEQEINGLLTYDRQPKVELSIIRAIVTHSGDPSLIGGVAAQEKTS
ncbi:glycoside hydrolase family 2 TIM barrel-domain containing protein [Geitlerinema calcuttense]|uniref:Glycoside hydrolase family 2 TIM barrel-domain containing protein n=1 Tax=Geitlerinema calcuttense NRMC-F 0142 TaxID=2922238 RepID=A0ABT7LW26_9CYAN|nr:glycoside hydrolase family 2 TIM barrel-domain containing protein [Geitlerinema calcuttense]MDL5056226.1 glycoside hydrolase family 2 TIM barrel-domain containing protein [Geitlerinema calcuttense NRMC-F 0142]